MFANVSTYSDRVSWWICINLLLGLRLIDILVWHFRKNIGSVVTNNSIQRYALGEILTAVTWSFYTVAFFDKMDIREFLFTIIVVTSLAAASASVFSASRFIAITYPVILLVPVSILALLSEQEDRYFLGLFGMMYSCLLIITCLKNSRFTARALYQKNINQQLSSDAELERNRVNKANEELKLTAEELNQLNKNLEQEVKKRTDEIYHLSNLDPLTHLVNRKAFTASLETLIEQTINKDSHLGLLFIDLNGFKKINETLGHKVGDSVLIQITQRISAFSENNSAGRWNGDEFLVALPYSDQDTAMAIAKAIITSISQPIYVHGNEVSLTACIGIAMAPLHSISATELIQLADLTMSEQKRSGNKHPRLFSNDLREKIQAAQLIFEGLQFAIEKKQFFLCYQPIQCAKNNVSFANEALLRWDFNGQLIGPDVFIPLAEKSGLIKEIGAWVLNRACMDASLWQHAPDTAVSVNVSVIQLMDDGFMRLLDNCLKSSGLPPERLHLEVTESTFIENQSKVRQQLEQIQARRIDISIDDFGTGYSSLSQLQSLPVNYVKIDKSFVDNVEGKGEAIIRATLFIARELDCKTIAEGVETKSQAVALSAMGVDYLQGYYFSKPMRNSDLIKWQNPITNTFTSS